MSRLTKLKSQFHQLTNFLDSYKWFPQIPLAVISSLVGLFYLSPLIKDTLGLESFTLLSNSEQFRLFELNMWGISQSAIGGLLLIMSLGLFARARFAWLMCILITCIALGMQLTGTIESIRWWQATFDSTFLLLLILYSHRFDQQNIRLSTFFALSSFIVFMGYAVYGTYHLSDQFSQPIIDLTHALYYVVVTITSVGYGDISPTTAESRIFTISVIVLGFTVLSAAVGTTLIPAFLNRLEKLTNRKQKMKRIDHYIIVGHSSLARNTYHELHSRGEDITVILPHEPTEPLFANIDVVIGDGSDVDVLKSAGGEKAKAILALLDDDSENAFVILATKELEGNIKTVAAVNDMKNMKHIRRVHPYLVIAPQVLGGELLSMALTGEKVDSSTIMQRLMGQAKLTTKKHS